MTPQRIAEITARVEAGWIQAPLMGLLQQLPDSLLAESVLPARDTLRALTYFPPGGCRVVILGQDPYPSLGKANGLAFGIRPEYGGRRNYSSFGNIAKELEACGVPVPQAPEQSAPGDFDRQWATLGGWARQGVLLLNTRLSVRPGEPMSHAGQGWESFVPGVLARVPPSAVWVCWGAEARRLAERLRVGPDQMLATSHPTKYSASRGSHLAPAFLGSGWPALVNQRLTAAGRPPIDWAAK